MLLGSGLSFQSCKSVSFAPVGATESTLELRRLGYIGRRLRWLLISEHRFGSSYEWCEPLFKTS